MNGSRVNYKGSRPRDNRRQRLYDAEHILPSFTSKAGAKMKAAPRLSTGNIPIPACQEYVDTVLKANWFQSRWGRISLWVGHKVSGAATGGGIRIMLPPFGRTEPVILHEIAHCLTPDRYAHHGPEFAGVLLTLVGFQMGAEQRKKLRAEFTKNKVRVSMAAVPAAGSHTVVTATQRAARAAAKKNRPVTIEERAAAVDILRRAAAQGFFGPAGRKPRVHALDTARALDKLTGRN